MADYVLSHLPPELLLAVTQKFLNNHLLKEFNGKTVRHRKQLLRFITLKTQLQGHPVTWPNSCNCCGFSSPAGNIVFEETFPSDQEFY